MNANGDGLHYELYLNIHSKLHEPPHSVNHYSGCIHTITYTHAGEIPSSRIMWQEFSQ